MEPDGRKRPHENVSHSKYYVGMLIRFDWDNSIELTTLPRTGQFVISMIVLLIMPCSQLHSLYFGIMHTVYCVASKIFNEGILRINIILKIM